MRLTARKPVLALVVVAALAALAVLWQTTRTEAQENPIYIMPRMTLTYETDGPAIGVGNRSVDFREVRRLDYTSKTQWTDTVIEAPTVDLGRYGTGSTVGSYKSINGNTTVSYDAMTDSRDEGTHEEGILVPNQALVYGTVPPASLDAVPGYTKSQVVSDVRVCEYV